LLLSPPPNGPNSYKPGFAPPRACPVRVRQRPAVGGARFKTATWVALGARTVSARGPVARPVSRTAVRRRAAPPGLKPVNNWPPSAVGKNHTSSPSLGPFARAFPERGSPSYSAFGPRGFRVPTPYEKRPPPWSFCPRGRCPGDALRGRRFESFVAPRKAELARERSARYGVPPRSAALPSPQTALAPLRCPRIPLSPACRRRAPRGPTWVALYRGFEPIWWNRGGPPPPCLPSERSLFAPVPGVARPLVPEDTCSPERLFQKKKKINTSRYAISPVAPGACPPFAPHCPPRPVKSF